MHPEGEKQFSKMLRVAFLNPDSVGVLDGGLEGDEVAMTTTLLEGADRGILCIKVAGVVVATCEVTRGDLLGLKRDFDLFARAKRGKRPFTGSKAKALTRAVKRQLRRERGGADG